MTELILALDLPDRPAALRLLDRIPELRWVKIGSLLMTAEGPALVRELVGRGLQVFLDLKWHDIPSTVAGAVAVAGGLGVRLATVHSLGGSEMLREAAAATSGRLSLVGVTVLTSHDAGEFAGLTGRPAVSLTEEAVRLGRLAVGAGLSGVVCSAHEVAAMRAALGPDALLVVPGIRRVSDAPGDQSRTAEPREAARLGATHLVVGRPILTAPDPAAALAEFLTQLG
jgi:orotidine-5'-phosphate decarboxylase